MSSMEGLLRKGVKSLSEFESKLFLAQYGIPITKEALVNNEHDAVTIASEIGYPVALKGSGEAIRHKTELNLIALNLKDESQVRRAFIELTANSKVKVEEILVQQMIKDDRELMVGLTRDAQLGPCVMFGLGGIFTELLEDVSFRVAPLNLWDAKDMMNQIRGKKVLDAFRGMPPVDREALADILLAVGQIGMDHEEVSEIDIHPLKLADGKPVAVAALVVFR